MQRELASVRAADLLQANTPMILDLTEMSTTYTVDQSEPSRTCRWCAHTGPLEGFARNSSARDGRRNECRPCWREKRRVEQLARNRAMTPVQWRVRAENIKHRFSKTRVDAKRRGLTFTLTFSAYAATTNQPCGYCGGLTPKTACGLDRMDNSRGYEADNIIPCCRECNVIKGARYTAPEMLLIGDALRTIRQNRADGK